MERLLRNNAEGMRKKVRIAGRPSKHSEQLERIVWSNIISNITPLRVEVVEEIKTLVNEMLTELSEQDIAPLAKDKRIDRTAVIGTDSAP